MTTGTLFDISPSFGPRWRVAGYTLLADGQPVRLDESSRLFKVIPGEGAESSWHTRPACWSRASHSTRYARAKAIRAARCQPAQLARQLGGISAGWWRQQLVSVRPVRVWRVIVTSSGRHRLSPIPTEGERW